MFPRFVLSLLYAVLGLSILAVATPWGITTITEPGKTVTVTATAPGPTVTKGSGDCNTGSIQCCNSTVDSKSDEANLLAGLLGIVLGPIEGLLGLGCSPISVIGVGGGSACSASPVCCENNSVGGLISIGCIPIIL